MENISNYPNDEQKSIIDAVTNSKEQTILVNACPGSGKTTLLVDIFQKCIKNWELHGGIACLSFTNVAQEKIKKDYGNILPNKHFVGTFDSFIYTYIIRPYGHLLGYLSTDKLYIIEEKNYNSFLQKDKVYCAKNSNHESIRKSTLDLEFIGENSDFPIISYDKGKFINKWTWETHVKKAKEACWQKGIINYSDLKYLTLQLLRHPEFGSHILEVLNYKFPYIFVDEIQDTGYFLEEILLLLMKNSKKNFLIGDSDQAIYSFTGAEARIFKILKEQGIIEYPLTNNFRSCSNITELISIFSQKEKTINSVKNYKGNNTLIIHNNSKNLDNRFKEEVTNLISNTGTFAILARRNSICNKFRYTKYNECPVQSHLAKQINYILHNYFNVDKNKAYKQFEKCISNLLFKTNQDYELQELLMKHNISKSTWKKDLYLLIIELYEVKENETWNDWMSRINNLLLDISKKYGLSHKSFNRKLSKDSNKGLVKRNQKLTQEDLWCKNVSRIDSIHGVKGEEFDTCLIYCEKPSAKSYEQCPSETWWDNGEEQRIIFVALSRAKKDLILCIHKNTYNNINKDSQKQNLLKFFNNIIEI